MESGKTKIFNITFEFELGQSIRTTQYALFMMRNRQFICKTGLLETAKLKELVFLHKKENVKVRYDQ